LLRFAQYAVVIFVVFLALASIVPRSFDGTETQQDVSDAGRVAVPAAATPPPPAPPLWNPERLAIVVQGPASGGLPLTAALSPRKDTNYVALFSYGYPQSIRGALPFPWSNWQATTGHDLEAAPYNFSEHIRVFSTWDTDAPEGLALIDAYRAAGFHVVLSNLSAFLEAHAAGGLWGTDGVTRSTLNLQMHTAAAGVRLAKSLGATHAMKARSDIFIKDFPGFLATVGSGGRPPTFTMVQWFDYAQGLWGGQHFVPSPHDVMYLGPVEDVLLYVDPAPQPAASLVFGELYEMDEYARARGLTRLAFCQTSDFLHPRLPLGQIIWIHNEAGTRDLKNMPHWACRTAACPTCAGCADRDICPPYAFAQGEGGGACPPNCA